MHPRKAEVPGRRSSVIAYEPVAAWCDAPETWLHTTGAGRMGRQGMESFVRFALR